jgi:hypothetical protein
MAWVRAQLYKLQQRVHSTRSDKAYQLLAHGRWFSPASSTTKTGRHDIAEILLKVALKHQKSKSNLTLETILHFQSTQQQKYIVRDYPMTIHVQVRFHQLYRF